MRRFTSRLSPATVIASIALFVSLGGVSYGVATGSIDSRELKNNAVRTKDLRNNDVRTRDLRNNDVRGTDVRTGTLTGSDIRNDGLAGTDINEATLAKVPSAGNADASGSAGSVASLDQYGQRASATPGASFDAARSAAPEVALAGQGAFSVYGKCFKDTTADVVYSYTYVRTTEGGSLLSSEEDDLDGNADFLEPGTDEVDREVQSTSAGANSQGYTANGDDEWEAFAASGSRLIGSAGNGAKNGDPAGPDGAYGAGDGCVFTGSAVG